MFLDLMSLIFHKISINVSKLSPKPMKSSKINEKDIKISKCQNLLSVHPKSHNVPHWL